MADRACCVQTACKTQPSLRSALGCVSVVVLDGVLPEHNCSFILFVVLGKFSMHQVAQIDSI